jgi:hypothetical protein
VCGVVIRGGKSQRMDAAYLFICKGVYRRIFLIVVGSEGFNVVSRVDMRRECKMTIGARFACSSAGCSGSVH